MISPKKLAFCQINTLCTAVILLSLHSFCTASPTSNPSPTVPAPKLAVGQSAVQTSVASLPTKNDQSVSQPVSIPLVTTLDGKPFDIGADKSYKVIYFYSNACPCVRNCETLTFKPLSAQYSGKVSFYAVVSGGWDLHDDRTNFTALLQTHHLPFPVLLDSNHSVADTLDGRAASQAVLLSPDNRVLFNGAADDSKDFTDTYGHLGHTKTYLADAIEQAVAGKAVSVPYVRPKGCSIDR